MNQNEKNPKQFPKISELPESLPFESHGLVLLDLNDVEVPDIQSTIDMMKKSGMMPISSAKEKENAAVSLTVRIEEYKLLEYSADLLAAGSITGGEYFKLKHLIQTGLNENYQMVRSILMAKASKNVDKGID